MSLGEYVRSIRARQDPDTLGLPHSGFRRVPGLRREEVAVLAGISVDYYTRIEQGREKNPSVQIIEALARGLDLTGDERGHLFRLAGYSPPARLSHDQVRPELARLIGRWRDQAAFVLSGTLDILAPNALARALFSDVAEQDNLVRMVFLGPAARTLFQEWEHAAQNTVAALRHNSTHLPDGVLAPFLRELSAASEEFRSLWEQQRVRGKTHAVKRFRHPDVGELELEYHALDIPTAPGCQLIIYDAEPGTASAAALTLLHAQAPHDREPARVQREESP